MKAIKYVGMAAVALTMASCSSHESGMDTAGERVAVEFSASVGVTQTRAIDQTWSTTDAIGIFMVKQNAEFKEANISEKATNIRYVVDVPGAGSFKANGTTIYYPMDASKVDFYAYYPQGTVTKETTSGNYEYALNVANQTDQETLDFMYSKNVKGCSKTSKAVALSFYHQLCKVILTVQPGEGVDEADLAELTVKVKDQNTTATFDLTAGIVERAATSVDISLYRQIDTNIYEAILLPDAATSRIFEFDLNNNHDAPFTWDMNKELVGGSKYTYTVKLNRTGVVVSGEIQGWNDETGGEVGAN